MRKLFLILLSLTLMSLTSFGQQASIAKTSQHIGYLEYLGCKENCPLIIFLHGSGERGDGSVSQLEKVKGQGTPKFLKNGAQLPFIVLSPQQSTGRSGYVGDIIPFIKYAIKNYSIDTTRIFVTGLSMGGDGSWQTAYGTDNVPNYVRAIAPISSPNGDYNGGALAAKRGIYSWVISGLSDGAATPTMVERPVKGVRIINPKLAKFDLIPGGHNSTTWDAVYRPDHIDGRVNIYEWFLSFPSLLKPVDPPIDDVQSVIKMQYNKTRQKIILTLSSGEVIEY